MKTKCPYCGTVNDSDTLMIQNHMPYQPQDGDVSICFQCVGISIYDKSFPFNLRRTTDEERQKVMADPQAEHLIACIVEMQHKQIPGSGTKQ